MGITLMGIMEFLDDKESLDIKVFLNIVKEFLDTIKEFLDINNLLGVNEFLDIKQFLDIIKKFLDINKFLDIKVIL